MPVTSGLRRDVDTLEQLDELTRLAREAVVRLGPRTSALVQ